MKLYTTKEIADYLNICTTSVRERANKLKLYPKKDIHKTGGVIHYWTENQRHQIINANGYKNPTITEIEIIYIHTIWHILPSKMNFM